MTPRAALAGHWRCGNCGRAHPEQRWADECCGLAKAALGDPMNLDEADRTEGLMLAELARARERIAELEAVRDEWAGNLSGAFEKLEKAEAALRKCVEQLAWIRERSVFSPHPEQHWFDEHREDAIDAALSLAAEAGCVAAREVLGG